MKNNQTILVGILAGIAAGMMVLAAFNSGIFAFVLFFIAPASVYIASMGWGTLAGIIAALVGTGISAAFGETSIAGLSIILLFGPAAYVGHLVNLAQRDESGTLVWFPLSGILIRLMVVLAAGFIAIGAMAGFTQELAAATFAELMKEIAAANPEFPQMDDAFLLDRANLYASMIPVVVPSLWLLMHVITAFLSANIARRSNLLAREREDVAANVALPFEASGFIAVGLALMFLVTGPLKLVGGVLLGLGISGYALVGLAHMHYQTRSMSNRGFILGVAYASIILFSVPLLVFTFVGLLRSMNNNQSGSGPNSGSNSSNSNNQNNE